MVTRQQLRETARNRHAAPLPSSPPAAFLNSLIHFKSMPTSLFFTPL